jgi:hypothetical protein
VLLAWLGYGVWPLLLGYLAQVGVASVKLVPLGRGAGVYPGAPRAGLGRGLFEDGKVVHFLGIGACSMAWTPISSASRRTGSSTCGI